MYTFENFHNIVAKVKKRIVEKTTKYHNYLHSAVRFRTDWFEISELLSSEAKFVL